jgi:hypothetical protein
MTATGQLKPCPWSGRSSESQDLVEVGPITRRQGSGFGENSIRSSGQGRWLLCIAVRLAGANAGVISAVMQRMP